MPTVFLAISPAGLKEAIQLAAPIRSAVWCGSDAVSEADFRQMAQHSVTRFSYPLQGESSDVMEGAMFTIEDHHPGATIWVEASKCHV
jgi:hypothetical protein